MLSKALSLFALLPLATAHFVLNWPTGRGFDDANAPNFPCGGFDSVKTPRTEFPMSGGPIQLEMHHTQTNVAVYMALGDNPGSFSIVLRNQFAEQGPNNFCIGMVSIPEGMNITAGTNATIQVVSNGDPDGGLYQCADVTLTDTALSQSDYDSHCQNSTGVEVTQTDISGNPNGTSSTTGSATPSGTGAAATGSSTPGAAAHATAVSWMLGAAGAAGLALL